MGELKIPVTEIDRIVAEGRYNGRLAPHLREILMMWSSGWSLHHIARYLHQVRGVPVHSWRREPLHPTSDNPLVQLIEYALIRSRAKPRKQPRQTSLSGVLPKDVAEAQSRWERQRLVARVHESGVTLKDIAAHLGISPSRAHQLLRKATRLKDQPSPLERYLAQSETRIDNLEGCGPMGKRVIEAMAARTPGRDWLYV